MTSVERQNTSSKLATAFAAASSVALVGYHLQKTFLSKKDASVSDSTNVTTKHSTKFPEQQQQQPKPNNLLTSISPLGSIDSILDLNNHNSPKLDENNCVIELSRAQWHEFFENGFVKIGRTMSNDELQLLRDRIEDIMMGNIVYDDSLLMQIDPSYGDSAQNYFDNKVYLKGQTTGFKGSTLNYRKIGEAGKGLECDDIYRKFMRKPLFKQICQRIYGKHASIGVYRAMVFNKPAPEDTESKNSENGANRANGESAGKRSGGGTRLPWHQDGGNWWGLDRDPQIFVWTALYPANKESGCVKAIKKSFKLGLVSPTGHLLSEEDVQKYCGSNDESGNKWETVELITNPGESWLVHNWTIHSSGINSSNVPRWAFSCNYIDGRTRVLDPKPEDSGPLGQPGQSFHTLWKPFE